MTTSIPDPDKARRRYAAWWHVGWTVAFVVAAMLTPPPRDGTPLMAALATVALPGALGLLLARRSVGRWFDMVLMVAWAAACAAAIAVTGGLVGAFAFLAVMPAPVAIVLGGGRRLAWAAALSATVAAVAGLVQAGGMAAPVEPQPWLTLFVLSAVGVALAAALLVIQRGDRESRAADRARLAALMGEQPLMIIIANGEGHVTTRFGAFFTGLSAEALGRSVTAIAADPEPLKAAFAQALAGQHAAVAFAPTGEPDRWFAATLAPYEGGVAVVLRDATLEHAREASLEQAATDAEALNAGKSRFLANMSHELRTPLNAIIGFSDIMRSRMFGPLSDKYAEYAGLIHESGGHLLDLINDVLDMSKIEAQRFELAREEFDARDAVSASLRLTRVQADAAGIQLRGVLPPTPLEVDADRRAIKQIVLNLISNALKFTPAGGNVTVTARADGGSLELVVADTGVGIAPADLERLGKPYEQAGPNEHRAMGTGLGLSLVRAFAELHGGTMGIESAQGEGTAVTVRLPVMLEAAAAPVAASGNVVAFRPNR